MNRCFDTCLSMQIQEHVREHNWSSGWVILSILAHRALLGQSYFSLVFSAFNTYNCSWINLTNKRICNDWSQTPLQKWPMLMTFFLTAIAAITGIYSLTLSWSYDWHCEIATDSTLFPWQQPLLQPTDRRTDQRTDKASYRVACPQLKKLKKM